MISIKKKFFFVIFLLFFGLLPVNVNSADLSGISENDFFLIDYKEKAMFNENHIMKIGYDEKIVLTKNDITYRLIGSDSSIENFTECVDLTMNFVDGEFTFIGKVKKYGIYQVDVQPIIKNSFILTKYSWFNSSFNYVLNAWVNHSQVPSPQYNIPIYVNITDVDVLSMMDDGDSVRFVADNNISEYSFEEVDFANTHGDWFVNFTTVSSVADTHFCIYYNGSGIPDGQDVVDTWDNGYLAVWHFTDGSLLDSTGNGYTLTNNGASSVAYGNISDCYEFVNDENDYLTHGSLLDTMPSNDEATFQAWVLNNEIVRGGIVGKINDVSDDSLRYQLHDSTSKFRADTEGTSQGEMSTYSNAVTTSIWYFTALRYIVTDKAMLQVDYERFESVNGMQEVRDGSERNFFVGIENSPSTFPYSGLIDEVFISEVGRDNDWLMVNYNNMHNRSRTPNAFILFGRVQQQPVPEPEIGKPTLTLISGNGTSCPCCLNFCFNFTNSTDSNFFLNMSYDGETYSSVLFLNIENNNYTDCFHFNNFSYMFYNSTVYFNATLVNGSNMSYVNFYIEVDSLSNCSYLTEESSMDVVITAGESLIYVVVWLLLAGYLMCSKNIVDYVPVAGVFSVLSFTMFDTGTPFTGWYFITISLALTVAGLIRCLIPEKK